jgi:DnaJ-domain-containing protein 1
LFTAVDSTFFSLENQTLGLKDLPTSKITGLDAKLSAVDGLFNTLNNKVDKQDNARLMTFEEGNKLSSLLGIREVSSDFTFKDGLLSFNQKIVQNIQEVTQKITQLENSYTWDDL